MSRQSQRRGSMVVVSGPSGAGKTTLYREVLARHPEVRFSVSCTTRAPRPSEVDGVDYYFLAAEEFAARVAAGAFLEHATVHGNRYGTLRSQVEGPIAAGDDVLLDIDIQGARQVRGLVHGAPMADTATFVFCAPPSLDVLRTRLEARGTDSPEVIARRLAQARVELNAWREYDWIVVNDHLGEAISRLEAIVLAARCRTAAFLREPWEP